MLRILKLPTAQFFVRAPCAIHPYSATAEIAKSLLKAGRAV